jgi:nucleoside-diphosphate-sugar epimerase
MSGDLLDPAFADRASAGATVLYHCVNPARYDRWDEELPPLFHAVLGAARRSGARLVVLDNLYMYGHTDGAPMGEDTPMEPCSDKGRLRAELAQELLDLMATGEMEIAIARASDYFGPNAPRSAVFGERFFDRLMSGKPLEVLGDPDARHSYSYTPDVARGLAELGTSEDGWGSIWHLPVAFQGTSRELAERFAAATNRASNLRPVKRWMMRALGLLDGQIRAAVEMMYQFEEDFVVDDSRFREHFGIEPTPIDDAVATTLAANAPATAEAA